MPDCVTPANVYVHTHRGLHTQSPHAHVPPPLAAILLHVGGTWYVPEMHNVHNNTTTSCDARYTLCPKPDWQASAPSLTGKHAQMKAKANTHTHRHTHTLLHPPHSGLSALTIPHKQFPRYKAPLTRRKQCTYTWLVSPPAHDSQSQRLPPCSPLYAT